MHGCSWVARAGSRRGACRNNGPRFHSVPLARKCKLCSMICPVSSSLALIGARSLREDAWAQACVEVGCITLY
eukprot:11181529-Lingulodinium_polyedra.AAC.1